MELDLTSGMVVLVVSIEPAKLRARDQPHTRFTTVCGRARLVEEGFNEHVG